jgi:hypothetical protein
MDDLLVDKNVSEMEKAEAFSLSGPLYEKMCAAWMSAFNMFLLWRRLKVEKSIRAMEFMDVMLSDFNSMGDKKVDLDKLVVPANKED